MAPVIIRAARPDDAHGVIALMRALAAAVEDPPPAIDAAQFIRDGFGPLPWFECFVADHDAHLVGYALTCRRYEAERRLWLADLYVEQGARRDGVARRLMAAAATHALALGCCALYWDLWRPNGPGRAFYTRLGATYADDLEVWRLDALDLARVASGAGGRA